MFKLKTNVRRLLYLVVCLFFIVACAPDAPLPPQENPDNPDVGGGRMIK